MSNVIAFLETMGQDASLKGADPACLEAALRDAGIEADARASILAGEPRGVAELLGVHGTLYCILAPKKDDEEEEEPGDDDEVTLQSAIHAVTA